MVMPREWEGGLQLKNKVVKNQLGMSLIELTIAIGLTGILSLVVVRSLKISKIAEKDLTVNQEVKEISDKIAFYLSNKDACKNTLENLDPYGESGISIIRNAAGDPVWDSSTDIYGSLGLEIEDISLMDYAGMSDGTNLIDGERGSTNMMITFKPVKSSSYKNRAPKVKIMLSVVTHSSTGNIISCFTTSSSVGSLWTRREDNPTDILYLNGRLGIGTDPTEAMDVVGGAQVQNAGGDFIRLNVNDSDYEIMVNNAKPIEFRNISQGRKMDVDMGNLSLDRHLKLGNTGEPCTPAITGSLRYVANTIQYCRDSAWRSMSYE